VRLVYSQDAVADLSRLRDFIARNDPGAAARIARELVERIGRLCEFPEMGRRVSSAPDPATLRDFILGRYVVRYSVHSDTLVILRIWHHHESRQGSA